MARIETLAISAEEASLSFSFNQETVFQHFNPENEIRFASWLNALGASEEVVKEYLKLQIIAFLKEYVGREPFHRFYYAFNGKQELCVPNTEISALEIFERSAEIADQQNETPRAQPRERAEAIGFQIIQEAFQGSATHAVWISPPSPEIEGFGEYSFVYVFEKIPKPPLVRVTAIRYRADPKANFNLLSNLRNILKIPEKKSSRFGKPTPQKFLIRPLTMDHPKPNPIELIAILVNPEQGVPHFNEAIGKLEEAIDEYAEQVFQSSGSLNNSSQPQQLAAIKRLILGIYNAAAKMAKELEAPAAALDTRPLTSREIAVYSQQEITAPIQGSCPSLAANPTAARIEGRAIIRDGIAYCPICHKRLGQDGYCQTCRMKFRSSS